MSYIVLPLWFLQVRLRRPRCAKRMLVFVKDSVKRGLQEINHERGARVMSAEGARGHRRRKTSAASLSPEAQEPQNRIAFGSSPWGRSHTNQKLSLGKRLKECFQILNLKPGGWSPGLVIQTSLGSGSILPLVKLHNCFDVCKDTRVT